MPSNLPRLLVAGLRGGSGKTTLTVGLAAALRRRAWGVAPFKKGPDYIDSAWLALAAGRTCRNLDTYLMGSESVLRSFCANTGSQDFAIIEGNRGLFDGQDARGTHSSAALARLLKAPVVLVADCSKTTRTIAALVAGCKDFEPDLPLAGVVLNQVANKRHEKTLRESIEKHTELPILGAIPRDSSLPLTMRHLGLVPPQEQEGAGDAIAHCADLVERSVDIEQMARIAREAEQIEADSVPLFEAAHQVGGKPRIGVVRDAAFHFYYPENIEALQALGAETVEVSAIGDADLPPLDGLYIGGGFPETRAKALAANEGFRASLKQAVEDGLPVYAECGGAMYLGQFLLYGGEVYPMAGVIPAVFGLSEKPRGHGYSSLEVVRPNPYYPVGHTVKGHEFHYSYAVKWAGEPDSAFSIRRGYGFDGTVEGVCRRGMLATFTHVHALGEPLWARALVERASAFRASAGRKQGLAQSQE